MVLKYLIQGYPLPTLYFGIANVIANGLVMLRCVFRHMSLLEKRQCRNGFANELCDCSTIVLWISQNIEDDYTYNLAL